MLGAEFVALAGRVDAQSLLRTFASRQLRLEVHDRTLLRKEAADGKHIFGEDPDDEAKLNAIGAVLRSAGTPLTHAAKPTKFNAFKHSWMPWDPYAKCEFALNDLAIGQSHRHVTHTPPTLPLGLKAVTLSAPLLPACTIDRLHRVLRHSVAHGSPAHDAPASVHGLQDTDQMLPGQYVEFGSHIPAVSLASKAVQARMQR